MRNTIALIDLNCVEHNINRIREIAPESEILAIIKANAYGHGMLRIAEKLDDLGVAIFGVAFADEGVILRQAGYKQQIIVLVPETNGNAKLCCEFDLCPVIYSLDFAQALSESAAALGTTAKGHLFVDTGMNREGLRPDEIPEFMEKAKNVPNLVINGICTHFATSTSNISFAEKQLTLFENVLGHLKTQGFSFKYIHSANSGGLFNLHESQLNIIRPGIAIYGYPPAPELEKAYNLKPILTLKTRIVSVRKIFPGDTVGYGMEFISDKETNIATIPIGYGDGYFKSNVKKTQCLINGKRYNFVGTICMDVSMVDTGFDDVKTGDEVVLIGRQGNDYISAYEIADNIGTIPYEITSAIAARVPRVYVG